MNLANQEYLINSKNKLVATVKRAFMKEKPLIAYWWAGDGGQNWGDALNPLLIKQISGREAIFANELINIGNEDVYSVIGSILENIPKKNLVVWGSGFISSSGSFKKKPREICAVRGPLTRSLIIKQRVECPEVYGDPALLYPLFYQPQVKREYKLGIIPHYADKNNCLLNRFKNHPDVLLIDILSGINKVVDDICRCECIASSSLHGIIAADAYSIPSLWIEFSDQIKGNGFKFHDYLDSVGRLEDNPIKITNKTTFEDIYSQFYKYKIDVDLINLIEACPFLNEKEAKNIKGKIRTLP